VNRREWIAATGLAMTPARAPARAPAGWSAEVRRLNLKHIWTTVMSSSEYRDTIFVTFSSGGAAGTGEGAGIVRYKESAQQAKEVLDQNARWLASLNPKAYTKLMAEVSRKIEGNYALKAAIDIALLDWTGQTLGIPVWRLFGLDRNDTPLTTFTIGIDKAEVIKQKVREAELYPVLKIKVGLDNDEEVMAAVRSVTKKPLRVDANEGFKTKEEAVAKINWLEKQGVEFIEQPLVASNLEDMNWIRKRVHMPIFADEACLHPPDVLKVAPYFDGVNVKVDKAGGLLEARRMIEMAKALGLKTMLGCMVSSSCAITAAAQLSPLVDYADLDGNLLISNDPFTGVQVVKGKLILPDAPGLGLRPVVA
jgi:L-alanine-DL-glutamate epimerase-like enolase superfamily enzyme